MNRLSLPKDAKDNFVDLSSNGKTSLRSNALVDISSFPKGASLVKLVTVKKVVKVITSMDDDDDFVSAHVVGQVNVKKTEITYRNPSDLISTIYRSLNDNQKASVKEIWFGFLKEFVVKKFSREICLWVLERYDEKRNVLRIHNNEIHITRRGVHDMYGLPIVSVILDHSVKGNNIVQEKTIENEVRDDVVILLDHADKGKKVVEEKINEEQVRNDVPIFAENANKGKKFVQDNIIDNEMRDDDWMDSGPSDPRFDNILGGSKILKRR
ncbi:unnamed protein product [Lactuca virosa]|uniref:Uncharacterized protein n=1 Tax=Lactuca virosa TaxID=75947 RepID=A0AAU9PG60_9ASTR|nr:unnamed protein product [Lactuca virosa]